MSSSAIPVRLNLVLLLLALRLWLVELVAVPLAVAWFHPAYGLLLVAAVLLIPLRWQLLHNLVLLLLALRLWLVELVAVPLAVAWFHPAYGL
ncbi:hypothetical protein, partial [Aquitalea magnusonii]|uniref:hypothetical protein n=1 Tax=Aquitalea magnusonii TaxID=332411 RepID=UPI00128F96B3